MFTNIYAKELEIYVPCHSREDLLTIKEIVDCRNTLRIEEIDELDFWIFEKQDKECFVKLSNRKDLTPNKIENKVIGRGIFIDILPLSLDSVSGAIETRFTIDDFKQHCNTESRFEKIRPLVEILSTGVYLQEQNRYSVSNELMELKRQNLIFSKKLQQIEDLLKMNQYKETEESKPKRYKPLYKGYSADGSYYECPVCKESLNMYQLFSSQKSDYCCPYCDSLFDPD